MTAQPKNVGEVIRAAADYFAGKGVPDPAIAAELLVARLLNCRRLEVHSRSASVMSDAHLEAMRRGMKRVAGGEPVQYVLGQWDFMGRTFKTDKRALIPRPETETLVESVLKRDGLWSRQKPVVLDIGTGSGCMVISIALEKPDALYLAIDVSADALELARENAAAHGLDEKIAFSDAGLSELVEPASIDAIVANLPYIPTAEYEKLPAHIRCHEPRIALDGGPNGMGVIEDVVQDAAIVLKQGGFLFMETGCDQTAAAKSLLTEAGFQGIELVRDLSGRDRVITAIAS